MKILSRLLLTLTLVAFSLSNTSCSSDAQSKSPEEEEEEVPTAPVEATTVETGEIAAFYTGTASLEAEEEALVVAKTGGIVIEVLAEEGEYVEEGQALVKLDDERLTLELLRAEAALSKLQQGIVSPTLFKASSSVANGAPSRSAFSGPSASSC